VTAQETVRDFLALTLPKAAWTHEAHLRVGLWHVRQHGAGPALALLRARIRAYNEATGVANTDQGGYHETITRLYVHLIEHLVEQSAGGAAGQPLEAAAQEVIDRLGARELPLRYFSRARLASVAARRGWVEPDRQPLPPIRAALD
jgi:hypothetical protein